MAAPVPPASLRGCPKFVYKFRTLLKCCSITKEHDFPGSSSAARRRQPFLIQQLQAAKASLSAEAPSVPGVFHPWVRPGDGPALLTPRHGVRAIRLSAVSSLPYPHVVLPGGEHLTHVVWSATRSVHLQAQRPHWPQFLGIDHGERICAQRGRHRGRAPITPDYGPPPSCLFRCHSGSFTPARFVDRTAAKSWARHSSPGPSLMPSFSSATGFSRPG